MVLWDFQNKSIMEKKIYVVDYSKISPRDPKSLSNEEVISLHHATYTVEAFLEKFNTGELDEDEHDSIAYYF